MIITAEMCCHGACQDITTGTLVGNTVTCNVCGYTDNFEDPESQSSEHCDAGYMNDMRFGDD